MLPALARRARHFSNVNQIVMNPSTHARPPARIFGAEPPRCWCYYFEKADLARQMLDWQQVAQLGDEARQLGFRPSDSSEWLPFIEGYVQVGRYQDAEEVVSQALSVDPAIEPSLGNLCKRLAANSRDAAHVAFIANFKALLSNPTGPA